MDERETIHMPGERVGVVILRVSPTEGGAVSSGSSVEHCRVANVKLFGPHVAGNDRDICEVPFERCGHQFALGPERVPGSSGVTCAKGARYRGLKACNGTFAAGFRPYYRR